MVRNNYGAIACPLPKYWLRTRLRLPLMPVVHAISCDQKPCPWPMICTSVTGAAG